MNNKLLKILIGVAVAIALGVIGILLSSKMGEVHENNKSGLESFGQVMLPGRDPQIANDDGTPHVEPSIAEKKLSTSEKIILSLSKEKDELLQELAESRKLIRELEAELKNLREFKETSQKFGGLMTIEDERLYAIHSISSYLMEAKDAAGFSDFQREVMATAAARAYVDILQRFQIRIQKDEKLELMMNHLPAYAFCLGHNIVYVPNNGVEQRMLVEFFDTEDKMSKLPDKLEADLRTVQTPCLDELNERTIAMLEQLP